MQNDLKMMGIDFVEFSSFDPQNLENLFLAFGFSKIKNQETLNIEYFRQNDIHFFLNRNKQGTSAEFAKLHGPSISAMAWRFEDPQSAFELALQRGAEAAQSGLVRKDGQTVPAIYGIGQMLIYFVGQQDHLNSYSDFGFADLEKPILQPAKGFISIDHLTNNVPKGTMQTWADFYKNIFNFTEVRYFDIRGAKTGLTSYALKSPCGTFCIPINEGTESKSQINEYLEEYKGPGVQHLAFLTEDILFSLDQLQNAQIETLDIDDEYYIEIFKKFPQVKNKAEKIKNHHVLVDGDEEGYLLQIFTKNLIGPIFIEIIERNNHYSFGEGNFGALFRSIERDQMKRGYLSK